jgi:RNA recognition motif-containing protein
MFSDVGTSVYNTAGLLVGLAVNLFLAKIARQDKENMETKMYVGNLAFSTTEEQLRTLFAQAGTVTAVDLIKDRLTGESKGFAFVQMANQSELQQAIRMFNGQSLNNREMKVNIARPKEEVRRDSFNKRRY